MMGGALGLAILASLADGGDRRRHLPAALVDGYQVAFLVGTIFALSAAVLARCSCERAVPSHGPHAMGETATEVG